ncbi:ShlB/FhaC/HecB family hemolysin secretion/activation protein [Aurantibacter sp.]|uniref:ShlB/FhaC/HecB family hemolysin secretion/activation protein n=1 Tax=Aurantibacter sp. TaxID=2807103 RepID=UPI00326420CF
MIKHKSHNNIWSGIAVILFTSLLTGCATHKLQFDQTLVTTSSPKKKSHTIFLASGLGNEDEKSNKKITHILKSRLQNANTNSTLLFLGDNISSKKNSWQSNQELIDRQLALTEGFNGSVTFLPGNNEWKSRHIDSIQRVEEYLDEVETQDDYVLPKNGCPLEYKTINDSLDILFVDSQWFISNWSRVKGINKKCTDIVTRRRFAEELEGYINDAQGKNLVIAMHHPTFSNGEKAGHKSFGNHMTPVPVLGTLINGINDLGAFSPENLHSRRYNYLRILVSSLAKASDRVTIVSGHEESLQYLSGGDIHQIISGSLGSKATTKRTTSSINTVGGRLPFKGHFTYGEHGFAQLDYFEDGSSQVSFITADKIFEPIQVLPEFSEKSFKESYKKVSSNSVIDSVYGAEKKMKRSKFFKFLWGERYRDYFHTAVTAPIAYLDTLHGGLKFTKKGGGHQSYSIRLEDQNQREFAMRSLRKDPLKYLKFSVRGVAYTEDDYMGTLPEKLISDFFTTAHPYMQLIINPMAKAVDVNHANTQLFYIPKQSELKRLNDEFGNELYFIEQRPSDEQLNFKGYRRTIDEKGKITEFESTTDMLEKIKSDESYSVDQQSYVRARVFDMLLGDWDRHQDQWRWAEYETPDGEKEFMPVPRDRDNAFPRFDGAAVDIIQWFIPITRQWQSYGPTIKNTKWLNYNGSRLDKALLTKYDADGWVQEAKYIQDNLSVEQIDKAFLRLPKEVQDSTANYIKYSLKQRLKNLHVYAKEYGAYLDKRIALYASEKDDEIKVVRQEDERTKVVIRRLLSDKKNEKIYERTFSAAHTKELWIYGLGDNDNFIVEGNGKTKIFVRLIGGYGKDDFDIKNRKALKVYDWKQEESEFEGKNPAKQLTDVYTTNTFHWRYFKPNRNILVPNFDFRTDDGFSIGVKNTYIKNGLNGNPFRQKHTLAAKYFFNFQATELNYNGIFANIIPKWNFEVDGYYSTQRYAQNFFGYGNESINEQDLLSRDFYRARTEQLKLQAGVAYHTLRLKALYESFQVEEMGDRFFSKSNFGTPIFEQQNYVGAETSAYYYNDNADDFPTKGLYFGLTAGYKTNTTLNNNSFGYFKFRTEIIHKLIPSGNLVLSTKAEYKTNFGNDYFFYHAPSIGGNNGLRGFRDERFVGKSYFYHSSDIRVRLKRYVTALAPVTVGAYGGFDYGRVWQPSEDSKNWHTSQGIGLWASAGNYLAFNLGYFNSVEGNLFQFGFGFGF